MEMKNWKEIKISMTVKKLWSLQTPTIKTKTSILMKKNTQSSQLQENNKLNSNPQLSSKLTIIKRKGINWKHHQVITQ